MTDISIIIPTLNRADIIGEALAAVAGVVRAADTVEIIVVDNGSTDRTAEVCAAAAARRPNLAWRYIYDDMPGLLTGRHRGAAEAKGQILAYLDDDALVAPTWLEALRDAFSDPKIALVGGPSRPRYENTPPAWLRAFWRESEEGRSCGALSLADWGPSPKAIDPCLIWGLNFAVRKSVFQACGGFHPDCIPTALQRFQGDGETGLGLSIQRQGLTALYHPDVAVTHVIPSSRLTPEAFERRGFYQGVCESYAQIRQSGRPEPVAGAWKEPFRPLKRAILREFLIRRDDASAVAQLMSRAHIAGFAFHQREVREDLELLEWVLRPNYFDYQLPGNWRLHLESTQRSAAARRARRLG